MIANPLITAAAAPPLRIRTDAANLGEIDPTSGFRR